MDKNDAFMETSLSDTSPSVEIEGGSGGSSSPDEKRVYLAGPKTNAEDDGREWRRFVREEWGSTPGIEWVDPVMIQDYDPEEDSEIELVKDDKELLSTCDAVLVGYTGDASPGTWREVEYAISVVEIPVHIWTGPAPFEVEGQQNPFSPWMEEAGPIGAWLEYIIDALKLELGLVEG